MGLTIITAGTGEYAPMIRRTMENAARFGYKVLPFDLGGLGFGERFDVTRADFKLGVVPPATFKPRLIKHAISNSEPGLFAWLDGDAVLVGDVEELESAPFDVAVTLREDEQIGKTHPWTNYLNSGVLFLRSGVRTGAFLDAWESKTLELPTDQGALNEVVGPGWTDAQWSASRGTLWQSPCGAYVHILDCYRWNFWHWPQKPPDDVKVLHYKSGVRSYFK